VESEGHAGLEAILRDVVEHSTPAPHGPHYDELVSLIEEELGAQIAMQRLGPVDPPAGSIATVADLVADMVDRAYHLERRLRP
jgi:hypothetical protein